MFLFCSYFCIIVKNIMAHTLNNHHKLSEKQLLKTISKGRGVITNKSNRFEKLKRKIFLEKRIQNFDDLVATKPKTSFGKDASKSIISRNFSPDLPFDRSINPYKGCEHGCVYCFARPTHAYLGLSPGLDFESRIFYKPNAASLLKKELRKSNYVCRVIALGTNTDPYQPIEKKLHITRSILKVLSTFNHPVSIVTKSGLIERDLDILVPMAQKGLVQVFISITTLQKELANKLEPRATAPRKRLNTLRALTRAGVKSGVLVAPVIPALNDHELENILQASRNAGASTAQYILLRLPLEVAKIFAEWLELYYPDKAKHVMILMSSTRKGKLYQSEFRTRMYGTGEYANVLSNRFKLACKRLGFFKENSDLVTNRFTPPQTDNKQIDLFFKH